MVEKDLYIGRNAGKELLEDIHNAKKSVKIISPYLSATYVEQLIEVKEKGVDVSLITADKVETDNYSEFTLTDIIKQKVHVDENALQERKTLLHYLFGGIGFSFLLLFFGLFVSSKIFFLFFLFILITAVIGYLYLNKRTYSYSYYPVFDLKVFFSQYCDEEQKNDFLVHAKVYIVDDKVAYLGSVNFTYSGIVNSFESIVRIDNKNKVEYLVQEYKKLFHSRRLKSKDVQEWGKELYPEPIN